MKFSDFLSKRVPTNFFVGKNSKLVMNVFFPGDMIYGEDSVITLNVSFPEGFFENKPDKETVLSYLKSKMNFPFDGVLIIKSVSNDDFECRFFSKNKEKTEYSELLEAFEKLNSDFKIKKSDMEFISGEMDCLEIISGLRKDIENKILKAEQKRQRKTEF